MPSGPPWPRRVRLERRARADPQSAAIRHGRLRARRQRRGHGGNQPSRNPRPALLRPGRFDRTVEIPLAQQKERTAILAIHGRGRRLGPDVDLHVVSRATPGFSGADLANLVNEAAINAVRDRRQVISAADFARPVTAADRPARARTHCCPRRSTPSPYTKPATSSSPCCPNTLTRWPRSPSCPVGGPRRNRATARVGTPPLSAELPHRFPRGAPGRPSRGDHRSRGAIDPRGERPRRSDPPRNPDGAGMGVFRRGRAHRGREGPTG